MYKKGIVVSLYIVAFLVLGMSVVALGLLEAPAYRYASWTCYDDHSERQGDETSCKPFGVWHEYAKTSCSERCNPDKTKCGVNSFSLYSPCTNNVCGNNICEALETQLNCPKDCCPKITPPLQKEVCTYTPKYDNNRCVVGYNENCTPTVIRESQKILLNLRNVYSPEGLMKNGVLWLYYGGWIAVGQVHDNIYLSTCTSYDNCGQSTTVLDSDSLGFEHLNDPTIVKLADGRFIMYMTGVITGENGLVASNNHVYYSISSDGAQWSKPVKFISKHWLPSATVGPSGNIYLYANDNSINGQVVRFNLGTAGIDVGNPEMVTVPLGRFYSNVHVMYRPALGFYQIFAEYHRADGSGAIDYLDSTDGIVWKLVHPGVVIPDSAAREFSVGSPAPHPDTHGIIYFGSTAEKNSMGYQIRVQTWRTPVCGNNICEEGEEFDNACTADCKVSGCTDSDGGKNYYEKGNLYWSVQDYHASDYCKGDKLHEYYCDGDYYKEIDFDCPNGCKDGACIGEQRPVCGNNICEAGENATSCPQDCATNFGLEYYPKMFVKGDKFNGIIVVGDFAGAGDVIAAADIITSLNKEGIFPGPAKLASEVTSTNQNIISIGGSCSNAITSQIKGQLTDCTGGLVPGEGYLRLYNNNGYNHLVVEGYLESDTRAAANVLVNYKNYKLQGTEYFVRSSLPECIDSDGGKNYYSKGTTTDKTSSFTDVCDTIVNLLEYSCVNDSLYVDTVPCQNGCKDGACLNIRPICGNNICEEGESDYCPPCLYFIPSCKIPCKAGSCLKDCPGTVLISISSINPASGSVGTKITITGTGFTPTGNRIYFEDSTGKGIIRDINSSDGTTLSFVLPEYVACYSSSSGASSCGTAAYIYIKAGASYGIYVLNSNGKSNYVDYAIASDAYDFSKPNAEMAELLQLINKKCLNCGLGGFSGLTWCPLLAQAALYQAQDMVAGIDISSGMSNYDYYYYTNKVGYNQGGGRLSAKYYVGSSSTTLADIANSWTARTLSTPQNPTPNVAGIARVGNQWSMFYGRNYYPDSYCTGSDPYGGYYSSADKPITEQPAAPIQTPPPTTPNQPSALTNVLAFFRSFFP